MWRCHGNANELLKRHKNIEIAKKHCSMSLFILCVCLSWRLDGPKITSMGIFYNIIGQIK